MYATFKLLLFEVAAFAKSLMFVCFFNGTQAPLHFSTFLQKVSETEIGACSNFMGLRGIQQFQCLSEESIGRSEIAVLMMNLRQGDQGLSLSLGIVTRTSEVEGFLRLLRSL